MVDCDPAPAFVFATGVCQQPRMMQEPTVQEPMMQESQESKMAAFFRMVMQLQDGLADSAELRRCTGNGKIELTSLWGLSNL